MPVDQKTCFQDSTHIHESKQSKEKQLQEKFDDNIIKKGEKKGEKKPGPPKEQNEIVIKMQLAEM